MQADPPNTNAVLAVAGISGISAHIFLYRHGEWDLTAPKIFIFYLTLLLGAVIVDHLELTGLENTTQRHLAVRSVGCHILAIYSSMLIYRALFHRLCKFPGPFLARLSNFYVAGLSAKKAQLYKETQRLHKLYGDYVRIGPTVLSITDPTAVKEIYSSKAKVSKGPFYTVSEPRVSLQTSRNKEEHARRRRVWDQAFSSKALRNYEPRVIHYTNQLINAIGKGLGKPMNVSKWFNYYSFDVMGDLSFGKSFNMLVDGKDSYILSQLHGDMAKVGIFIHLTWLFPFFKRTPGLNKEYLKFWRFVEGSVVERIQVCISLKTGTMKLMREVSKNPPDRPDVFSWILDAYNKAPKTKQNWLDVIGDAYLIIVAGSDTTAATLTFLFYHLASDKFLYKKLQAELDTLSELSYDKLRNVGCSTQ
ncbi:Cytochrome p450 [Aspergillus sclerotialis]|uniref:Cytochrome p450 n=1 Tax=Aspergillus sclerotialis TaxID=2070753 RepID=A0A3A2ZD97_9EURO|nr:Cytochrome p450 [Aspergillus sclerotialis]